MQFIDLNDRVFIVSGASSGIGRETSRLLYQLGAKVAIWGRNVEALHETAKDMDPMKCHIASFDITDSKQLDDEVSSCVEKFEYISGICHSAGFEVTLPLRSMRVNHYVDLYKVNTVAAFELARVAAKKKNINPSGASFVFISSITEQGSRPGLTGYSASKGALVSGTRALALELASKNIRVNCVSPGTVKTELIENLLNKLEPDKREKRLSDYPLGLGEPIDVANLVAFMLSDRSRWITGTNVTIDGGYTAI